jgi:zinc D-Ala-D-Ala carboxypeptidase
LCNKAQSKHFNVKKNIQLLLLAVLGLMACQSSVTPPVAISNTPEPATKPVATDSVSTDLLMGKFVPATHPDFVKIASTYTDKPGMMLQKAAYDAFVQMHQAAKSDGVVLRVISSTRTFEQQKNIWEAKWERFAADHPAPANRAAKILEYSSMPGSSRHHWGTDIDLNALNNEAFEGNGPHRKVYDWLVKNASKYGYGQPYTPKGPARPNGYNEEKWHWSYLPLARGYRQAYLSRITNEDIKGFKGADTAPAVHAVEHYVGGVSQDCQ